MVANYQVAAFGPGFQHYGLCGIQRTQNAGAGSICMSGNEARIVITLLINRWCKGSQLIYYIIYRHVVNSFLQLNGTISGICIIIFGLGTFLLYAKNGFSYNCWFFGLQFATPALQFFFKM
jgi:hypothetical protein